MKAFVGFSFWAPLGGLMEPSRISLGAAWSRSRLSCPLSQSGWALFRALSFGRIPIQGEFPCPQSGWASFRALAFRRVLFQGEALQPSPRLRRLPASTHVLVFPNSG